MPFKPHFGTCSCGCGKQGLVCVSAGYIQQCNVRIKKERKENSARVKPVEQITDYAEKIRIAQALRGLPSVTTGDKVMPPKKRQRKVTGEGELFDRIWADRLHFCEVCSHPIVRKKKNWVHMFSHILSKGSAPELRLDEENIWLMGDGMYGNCDCHIRWETRTADMRNIEMWKPVFLLQEALKIKAHGARKNRVLLKEDEEI